MASLSYRLLAGSVAAGAAFLSAAAFGPAAGAADMERPYYAGKNLSMVVASTPGGGYDTYARLVANHYGAKIPGNPDFIVRNMPGAGGLRAVDYLFNVAPRDATYFGAIQRGALFEPLMGSSDISFDPTEFGWLGSTSSETGVVVAMKGSPVKTAKDLFETKFVVGGTGVASDPSTIPLAYNTFLGTKFEVINGYPGMGDVVLAAKRGEVHGAGDWSWSNIKTKAMKEVESGEIILLMQSALSPDPDLPHVPMAIDLAPDDESRQALELLLARKTLGRPFLVTPGTPPKRLEMLQAAFMEMMKDPEFLADAERLGRDLTPVSGTVIERTLKRAYSASDELVARLKAAIEPSDSGKAIN